MAQLAAQVIARTQAAIRAHLEWLYRIGWQRPRTTLGALLIALLLAGGSVLNIHFESDIFKLFPANNSALQLFLDTLEWTGSAGEAYFLLEGPAARLPAAAEDFATKLRHLRVDGEPAFRRVTYRTVDPSEATAFARFVGYAVYRPQLFLPPAATGDYNQRLTPAGMAEALQRATRELMIGSTLGARDLVAADPLYLRELILPRLKEGSQSFALAPDSPYLLSRDGTLLIMIAEPARPVQDMAFARRLVAGINRARLGSDVAISCAGAHLSAVIDEAVMKRNIVVCVISSLLVVLALFYLTYRRLYPTLLLPVIIACGTVLSLGAAGLLLQSIHIISFAFTALIVGLGTDYSIHLYDRFHAERQADQSTTEALRLAVVDTGQGIFTAATTTALPFLALTISDVRALSELGLLVGLGVIFSMYATFLLLPPVLLYTDRHSRGHYALLPAFGLGGLWRLTRRVPRLVTGTTLVALLGLAGAATTISFEGDLKNLQPRHSEAFLTQERIERHLSIAPRQLLVELPGDSLDALVDQGSRVALLAERYRQEGKLTAVSWLGQILNARPVQEKILATLHTPTVRSAGRTLSRTMAESGFEPAMFPQAAAGLDQLPAAGPVPLTEALQQLRQSPFAGMVSRYLVERNGRYHLLLYLHYRGSEFPQKAFIAALQGIAPTARVTSTELISAQLANSVRTSFARGFLIGGVLVLALLLVHFESLRGIAAALLPVFAGVVAMLGLMALTGMRLNFMNAMVLVTILGMGSDYGLHVYHRLQGGPPDEAPERFTQAGRAVLLSALTTIAGFGSLAFTDYGAMASIGWATNFGIAATMLFALVALPAALALFRPSTIDINR